MQRLEPIIAIIALIVAVLVAFGVYHLIYTVPRDQPLKQQCASMPTLQEIMVASKMINTGDSIMGSISYEQWPVSTLRKDLYTKNQITEEQLKSLIARRVINQG